MPRSWKADQAIDIRRGLGSTARRTVQSVVPESITTRAQCLSPACHRASPFR
jgi:hypothetical protein